MNFFDIIQNIYRKEKKEVNIDNSLNITLNKWLSYDPRNLCSLSKLLKYLFFVEPIHYYYLLFFNIPQSYRVPFLKKIEKEKIKENKLLEKIRYVLGWTKRELELNKGLLSNIDRVYWKKELGVK